MNKENENFFNGMLLGGLLLGLSLVTVMSYMFMQGGQPNSKIVQMPVQPQILNASADIEEEVLDQHLYESISVDNVSYTVVKSLQHPVKDLLARILVEKTKKSDQLVQQLKDQSPFSSFNGTTEFVTSNYSEGKGEGLILSLWSSNGEELLMITNEESAFPIAENGYLSLESWQKDLLVLVTTEFVEESAFNVAYLFDYTNNSFTKMLEYETGWLFNDDQEKVIYSQWSYQNHGIYQLRLENDVYSDIYRLEDGNQSDVLAFEASTQANVDIHSPYNLNNISQGLQINLNKQLIFIPWTK